MITVGSDALQVLVTYQSVGSGWRVGNRLRLDLARHALRLDLDWHGRHSAGLLIERLDGDVAAIVEFSSVAVLQLLGNAILVSGRAGGVVHDRLAGRPADPRIGVGGLLPVDPPPGGCGARP